MAVNVSALDNTGGRITAANGSLGVSASNIDNTQGMMAAAGNVRVEGGADLVNQGGKIQGLAGDVTLHVRDLRNDGGSVFAGRNLSTTAHDVDNGGSLFAAGSQTLEASGAVDGDGVIAAQGNVTVNAASLAAGAGSLLGAGIRADGMLGAGGRLAVTTSQTLQAGGQVLAGGNAELSGASLNLAGSQASAANMALTADSGNIDTRSATLTTGTLALTASRNGVQTWTNVGGDVQANQLQAQVANLANAAGKIIQLGSGDTLLSTSGTFDNSGGQIAVNSRNLTLRADALSNAGGTITHAGSGALTIEAGHFDGHDGSITGNGSLSLRANDIDHRNGDLSAQRVAISAAALDNSGNGRIIQFGTGQGGITITHALNNAGGRIGSNGSTTIAAGDLDNSGGGVLQAGGTADLNLNVGGILANSGGSITVGGNGLVSAGSVDNRYGTATAAGAMTIDTGGELSNTSGTLAASGDLAVAAANLDNTAGKLISTGGNLTLENTGATTNRSGQIQAAGKVGMISAGLANGAGGVVSGHDVDIDTRGQGMNNAGGTIAATSAANLQTGALNNDGGRIQSGSALVVDTHGQALVNINAAAYGALNPGYSGGITGGTATTLYTGNLDNSDGFLAAGGQLSGSTAYLTNAGGEIAGMRSVSFTTSGLNNQGGSIQAVDSLGFDVSGGTIMNYAGLLRAGQALTLNADVIDNHATQGSNQGIEGGDLTLNSADLNNSGGALRANNNLTVSSAGTVGNSSGLMSAMKSLSILDTGAGRTLAIDNAGGTLIGGEMTAIRAASLDGVGRVLSQQDMNIDLAGGYALEAGTELIGNRNVMLSLGGGLSNAGKLQAGGTLSLNAASLDNAASGDINGGSTRINAGWLINRGVIDGINTDIDTGTLTNVGTGRIYGDRIGIAAGSVVNDVENGMAGTIAARSYLALGASSISNREHALIFSGGDMGIGGRLDGNRDAVGWMGSLTNASATVEALGSMTIGASRTNVLNNHFTTTAGDFGPSVVITEYFVGNTPYSPESGAHLEMDTTVYDHYVLVTPTGRYTDYEIHTTYRSTASTVVQSSDPGVLAAGANLTLASDAVLNQNSQIVAGQALNIPGDVLTNESTASKTVVREHVTVDHREYHGVTDIKPGYYDTSTNWTMSYDKPDVVIDGASGFTFHHTPSSAPTAKAVITVTGSTSAASAATVSESAQVTVSGPSVSTASDSVDGRQASVTMGSNAAVNAAHLGVAAQTGALQGAIHGTPRAVLAGTRDVSTVGTVATVGIIGAAGAVASASSTGIDGSSASLGAIRIGIRKTAGETGTMAAVGGVRSTAPIGAVGGIGGVGQPTEIPTETTIGDRKDASVASSVTGVTATGSTGAIAATINESHVSVIVPSLPSAPTPAGATGTGVAPFPAWAAAGGPKPGTSTPNVRDIAQVPLASPSANAEVVRTSTEALVVPNASLYKVSPAPLATYLVQTDPRFTDYRAWTSADYLTSKVPTDPSVTQKRLGDGFYEQQLVREQMTALTGYRYSGDYTSDEQQYRGLMDAAASFAVTWNLRPGVALTAAQMAALTSDIVWLVEQNVTLADGSTQKVLVPQVYVRVREGDLDGSGALLSGKEVNIALNGDFTNSGTIAGRQVVNISAENINNLSGRIHGDDLTLQARNDLNSISGTISANTALLISAGRDINSAAGTANITRDGWTESLAGRVAGLYVTGNESGQGSLVATAGGDINLSGSIVSNNAAAGISALVAQRNLNLSAAKDSDLSADRRVELSAGGAMALKAGADLNILAANSQVSALHLRADNDINNIGNTLSAKNSLVASAGRDINLRTTTTSVSLGTSRTGSDSTTLDKVAGLSVTGIGAGSTLLVSAGRDINLAAAEIGNAGVGGATGLNALRDLNLGTVSIAARNDTVKNANNYRKENSTSEIGTVINGAGSVLLDAGNNVNVRAGQVDAGTGLSVNAGNNIDITTGTASYSLDQSTQTSKSGFLSKKVTTKRDTVDMVTSISSTLTGSMVSMRAGNDLNVTGSAVVGDAAVKLAAGKDINIVAAIDTSSEWNHVEEKKSGFLNAGGFGISYGTRTTTTNQTRDVVTQSGQARSMVGSIGGDLMLDAGNAIKVSGTDMSASHDMSLAGKDVTIDAGKDKIDSKFETRVVQDAISLRVGGSVVNAIQSVQGVQQAVEATDNKRVHAMAAAMAAMAVKDAAAQAKDGLSVGLSLTAGHSESVQTTTTTETLHTGSALTAGRDVSIVAKGDGASGNINVVASDINAGRNMTLAASNGVNLVAAQDMESQHSESKSTSAEAGVAASYSTNGGAIGFTASVSGTKGHDDGEGTTQVNSKVNASQTLTIVSGGDTSIKGAVASGNQVIANVGGNLNLESLQDTAKFDSKTQSVSVIGTYGYGASVSGSASQTTIKSDYASIQEQSGINAGNGGFRITVGENTDLKGAVISSTEAGTVANSLVTKTLTQSEIENYSRMAASSIGLSGSVTSSGVKNKEDNEKRNVGQNIGPGKGLGETNLVNVAATNSTSATPNALAISHNDNSTTRSGISVGVVTVTGNAAQSLAGIDRTVLTGTNSGNRLDNKFNAAETQTALQVTEQFTQTVVATAAPVAAKLVGDIAGAKEREANEAKTNFTKLAVEANELGNKTAAAEYSSQAKAAGVTAAAWSDDGVYRVALHATAQGAIGSMAGGNAGAVGGIAGVVGGNVGKQVGKFLANAQAEGLSEAERRELVNTYQQTMATLGGAVVGMAAGSGTSNAEMLANAMQSGTTSITVDVNNRQLHEKETAWIRENAAAFAEQVNAERRASGDASGVDITHEEAAKRLAQQAAKDTDLLWRGLLPVPVDEEAKAFLHNGNKLTFTNNSGQEQAFFTTEGRQFMAPQDGALSADQDFIDQYLKHNGSHYPLSNVAEEIVKIGKATGSAIIEDPTGVLKGAFNGLVESLVDVAEDPYGVARDKLSSIESGTKTFAEGLAVSFDSTSKGHLNNLYGRDVTSTVSLTTIYQGVSVVSEVADFLGAAKLASVLGKGAAESAAKAIVRNEVQAFKEVLDPAVSQVRVDIDRPHLATMSQKPPAELTHSVAGKDQNLRSGFPTVAEDGILPMQSIRAPADRPPEITQPHPASNGQPNTYSEKDLSSNVDKAQPDPFKPERASPSISKPDTKVPPDVANDFYAMYARAPAAKIEIDKIADEVAEMFGGKVAKAPIKSQERALEKIMGEYAGVPGQIKDLARNTIIVQPENISSVVAELSKKGADVKIIDGATDPLGYSGAKLNIKTQSGITAEIQVNSPIMIYAKESESIARSLLGDAAYDAIALKSGIPGGLGHELYEQWRVLDYESPQATAIAEKSRAYYEAVRKANGH
jgi:filamentous hemagglutinin